MQPDVEVSVDHHHGIGEASRQSKKRGSGATVPEQQYLALRRSTEQVMHQLYDLLNTIRRTAMVIL